MQRNHPRGPMLNVHHVPALKGSTGRLNSGQELELSFDSVRRSPVDAQLIESNALLTPAEVAAILYVDPKTVTRWAKAGSSTRFARPVDTGVF